MFGLNPKRKAGECLGKTLAEILAKGEEPFDEVDIADRATRGVSSPHQKRVMDEIIRALKAHEETWRNLIKLAREERPDVTEIIRDKAIVCIDLSGDTNITLQQALVASILDGMVDSAIATKGDEFSCVNIIEEAAFYAPEQGGPRYGSPEQTLDVLVRCLSQAGGYNIGFILCSQRPAYVSKNVLSQCNTFIIFKMLAEADHRQVAAAMGLPLRRISAWVSNLMPHEALLFGLASPLPFPVLARTRIREYPRKATKSPVEVLKKMTIGDVPS